MLIMTLCLCCTLFCSICLYDYIKIVNEPCFLSSPAAAHTDVCARFIHSIYKLQMQHLYVLMLVCICACVRACECASVFFFVYVFVCDMFAWCAPLPYPASRHVNKCEFSRAVAFVCTSSLAICTSSYFVHRCIIFRKSVVTLIAYSVCQHSDTR